MPDDTAANKQVARDFLDRAFNQREPEDAVDTHMAEPYVQHNPGASDGMAASKAAIRGFIDQFPEIRIDFKRILADGNLVALHHQLTLVPGTPGFATVDLFRVEDGKIREHWDVLQEIPTEAANDNTMF